MKALTVLMVALLALTLAGCISSVNPLFTESELVFDTDLLGDWSDGESQISFTREGENAYILITSDEGDEIGYKTHLVKLDNNTFLDIYPSDNLNSSFLFEATHFPVHYFYKIEIMQEEIILSEMDNDLATSLINDSHLDISYVVSQDGWILLTASTEKLQNFIRENENLFTDPVVFRREK
ncbi:MAG TPA: hypothetical protein VLN72_06740 [Gillisia sp.]|nr:hypothetical protein [Gillisia sp.]